MRALDERLALDLVEQGGGLLPLDRALFLVAEIDGISMDVAADLPLDRRDRCLIDAYISAFGSRIVFFVRCPECGEAYDAEFDLASLPPASRRRALRLRFEGNEVRLRVPTSRAVAAAAATGDPSDLLHFCAPDAPRTEPSFAAKIEERLVKAFPLLDISFEVQCSECSARSSSRFDIGEWFWRRLEGVAERAVEAVDRLARAYGWSEGEVLSMSPARRAMYLARVA